MIELAGRFQLDISDKSSKLGSGAFGQVFRGFDIEKNRDVAVKLEPIDTKHP